MSDYIPPEIQRYIDRAAEVGLQCEVVHGLRKMTLTWVNDRVKATAEFRYRKREGWYNHRPALSIDGHPCEPAHSFAELKIIINEPDLHLTVQKMRDSFPNGFTYCDNPPVTEMVYEADDLTVPHMVSREWAKVSRLAVKHPQIGTIQIEHPHPGLWQIRIKGLGEGGNDLVVQFTPSHETWKVERVILTVLPGPDDLALDLGKRVEEAFGGATQAAQSAGFGPAILRTQAPRGKNDQLVVKSNTVIRT